jgi:O-antigen/teichoic acid export membrane protein
MVGGILPQDCASVKGWPSTRFGASYELNVQETAREATGVLKAPSGSRAPRDDGEPQAARPIRNKSLFNVAWLSPWRLCSLLCHARGASQVMRTDDIAPERTAETVRDAGGPKLRGDEIALAVQNSLKLGGSLLVTWSVALIVKLQIPAHLGPVRQGHFGFAESFAAMFFSFLGLGVDTYVIKEVPVRRKHASDFVGGVFALRVILGVVVGVAMAITLRVTGRAGDIELAAIVFGATQLLININATLAAVLQAVSRVGRLAVANIVAKVIWGLGVLVGLHYGVGLYLLALPMLASELLRTAVLVPAARIVAGLRYRLDLNAVRSVLVLSFPFFVNLMAITFGNNLGVSALEFIRKDEREVGWFAASMNLGSLAMLLHPLIAWVAMPMLSRAYARSPEEMTFILRRVIEGVIVIIAPITTIISVGSAIFLRAAFGEKYLPATTGLSILSLMFLMTYLNIILGSSLMISNRSWTVTLTSLGSIVVTGVFMLVFVPVGRLLLGTGGECAGAATAVIASEACVVFAMLSATRYAPLDRRNVRALVKSIVSAVCVILADRLWRSIGPARLLIDMALYTVLALGLGVVKPADMVRALRLLREQRGPVIETGAT